MIDLDKMTEDELKLKALYNYIEQLEGDDENEENTFEKFQDEIKISGTYIEVPGEGEFVVFTDTEADVEAHEQLMQILEDIGIEGVSPDFADRITNDEEFINRQWFEEALEESARYFYEDMEDNEILEEAESRNIIDEFVDEDEDWNDVDSDTIDNIREKLIEMYIEAEDAIDWFKFNFGEKEFNDVILEKGLIDFDKVADEILEYDGRGPTLASYDSREHEIYLNGDFFFIYQTN